MKLLSFFFAVIVLLESIVMVLCIEDVRHAGKDKLLYGNMRNRGTGYG